MHIHRVIGFDPYTFRCGDRLFLLVSLGLDEEGKSSSQASSPPHAHTYSHPLTHSAETIQLPSRQKNIFFSSDKGTVGPFGVDFCAELPGVGLQSSEYIAAAQFVGFIRRASDHRRLLTHRKEHIKDGCAEKCPQEEGELKRNVSFLSGSKVSSVVDEDLMCVIDEENVTPMIRSKCIVTQIVTKTYDIGLSFVIPWTLFPSLSGTELSHDFFLVVSIFENRADGRKPVLCDGVAVFIRVLHPILDLRQLYVPKSIRVDWAAKWVALERHIDIEREKEEGGGEVVDAMTLSTGVELDDLIPWERESGARESISILDQSVFQKTRQFLIQADGVPFVRLTLENPVVVLGRWCGYTCDFRESRIGVIECSVNLMRKEKANVAKQFDMSGSMTEKEELVDQHKFMINDLETLSGQLTIPSWFSPTFACPYYGVSYFIIFAFRVIVRNESQKKGWFFSDPEYEEKTISWRVPLTIVPFVESAMNFSDSTDPFATTL